MGEMNAQDHEDRRREMEIAHPVVNEDIDVAQESRATVAAVTLKRGDRISYRGERVERVHRVEARGREYVWIRTDHCDRTVRRATAITVVIEAETPPMDGTWPTAVAALDAEIAAEQARDRATRGPVSFRRFDGTETTPC